jgi:RNA polymerase sigma factor (sigma-70 family)
VTAAPSLQEFAEAHGRRLMALCIAMAGNEHDGWDLVQATFERMVRASARVSPTDPWAYAVRIAANLNVDRIRRGRREVVSDSVDIPPVELSLPEDLEPWLLDGLAQLTPGQRTAVSLRYLDDMAIPQIANLMNTSESTIRTHLSRGSERLRIHARKTGRTREEQ